MRQVTPQLEAICQAVQQNCHIADANQAGDYTLCVYLLKMRELYRWEQARPFSETLANDSVGVWLKKRELLWDDLADKDFSPLHFNNNEFDPFDSDAINSALLPYGMIYSGGFGLRSRPHFFLAKLERHHEHEDFRVYISADEYARDITAPPAMSLGNTIYIRREAVKRMLWEKIDTWNWNKPDNAMGKAIAAYDFKNDVDSALDKMTEAELENILLHEIGEVKAGKILGQEWEELLINLTHSKAEIMLRAVRDHLADALSTLPAIIDSDNPAALNFYIGNLTNMHKHLYPALIRAYESWLVTNSVDALKQVVEQNALQWQQIAKKALALGKEANTHSKIVEMIENNRI